MRRQAIVLSKRPKFAVGTFQADHLTMFTRLDSVAQGGRHSLMYGKGAIEATLLINHRLDNCMQVAACYQLFSHL